MYPLPLENLVVWFLELRRCADATIREIDVDY
jgi:hypothetical protein